MPTRRVEPGPGQESVWDYPRPPAVQAVSVPVAVHLGGVEIARSTRSLRVLETSHPPVYYLPPEDVVPGVLEASARTSYCEFKGSAGYYTVVAGERREREAAWFYPRPSHGYEALTGYVAFYPGRMDACYVGDERVQAQEGDFYGGWVTASVVGPFKGGAGTWGW
ncbi:MAG: DUF427 domain-containing protein [Mycobacteriales bacterium]